MQKIKVSIDGKASEDTDVFEGYTDSALPTPHIALSRDVAVEFLSSTPYDFRFMKDGSKPFLRVYRGERYEDIPSTSIPTLEGEVSECYFLDGYGLAEIE